VNKGISSAVSMIVIAASLLALPVRSSAQATDNEEQRKNIKTEDRRKNIRYMEGVLVQAVRVGAEQFGKVLERYEPAAVTVLIGSPRARGFLLDGHGIFFDVEVPDINQSVIWSVMTTLRDRQNGDALESLREALRTMPEGASLAQAQNALRRLASTIGPVRPASGASPQGLTASGPVSAANEPPMDPRKQYQDAVISAVVDVMLGYSVQMSLGPEEWLTVAARGSDTPLSPQQGLSDSVTITVRVKGSDLASYHAADADKRAEIREKVKADARVF